MVSVDPQHETLQDPVVHLEDQHLSDPMYREAQACQVGRKDTSGHQGHTLNPGARTRLEDQVDQVDPAGRDNTTPSAAQAASGEVLWLDDERWYWVEQGSTTRPLLHLPKSGPRHLLHLLSNALKTRRLSLDKVSSIPH